jgi:hypothetical protein
VDLLGKPGGVCVVEWFFECFERDLMKSKHLVQFAREHPQVQVSFLPKNGNEPILTAKYREFYNFVFQV